MADKILKKEYPPERPKTRGECRNMPRPCPFVSCRYHLALDILDGNLKFHKFPDSTEEDTLKCLEDPECCFLEKMPETCALDVAEKHGPVNLYEMGQYSRNVTAERIRVLINKALLNVALSAKPK